MSDRTTSPQSIQNGGLTNKAAIILPIILFVVMLLFAIVVTLRYAA